MPKGSSRSDEQSQSVECARNAGQYSTLLRNFAAYSAALAGYIVVLTAFFPGKPLGDPYSDVRE
jgi:hypothetical protein